MTEVKETATQASTAENKAIRNIATRLRDAVEALETSTKWLLNAAKEDQPSVYAAAASYMKQFGNVAGGHYLTRGALAAAEMLRESASDKAFLEAKIAIADFYAATYLTEAVSLTQAVTAGAGKLSKLDPSVLSA